MLEKAQQMTHLRLLSMLCKTSFVQVVSVLIGQWMEPFMWDLTDPELDNAVSAGLGNT